MRFLLLGGTGQVGREFRALTFPKNCEVVAPVSSILDLKDGPAICRMISAGPWSAVINAAAYTDVDRAESDEAAAFAVNAAGPSLLAAETACREIPLIHVSTDYVFDGRKGAPYVELDQPAPLNVYGRSKLAGERAVSAGNPRHVILRTSWIYSPYRKNFVKTIVRLAGERDCLRVVADQRSCPTAARDVAAACLDIAIHCASEQDRAPYGVYHYAGAGDASWFEFARAIIEMSANRVGRSSEIIPIKSVDYPAAAIRPADTRLDCSVVVREFGMNPRPWPQALQEMLDRLLTNMDLTA